MLITLLYLWLSFLGWLCYSLPNSLNYIIQPFTQVFEAHSFYWNQIYFRALKPQHETVTLTTQCQLHQYHSLESRLKQNIPKIRPTAESPCSHFFTYTKTKKLLTRSDPHLHSQHVVTKTQGERGEQHSLQSWSRSHLYVIILCENNSTAAYKKHSPMTGIVWSDTQKQVYLRCFL